MSDDVDGLSCSDVQIVGLRVLYMHEVVDKVKGEIGRLARIGPMDSYFPGITGDWFDSLGRSCVLSCETIRKYSDDKEMMLLLEVRDCNHTESNLSTS